MQHAQDPSAQQKLKRQHKGGQDGARCVEDDTRRVVRSSAYGNTTHVNTTGRVQNWYSTPHDAARDSHSRQTHTHSMQNRSNRPRDRLDLGEPDNIIQYCNCSGNMQQRPVAYLSDKTAEAVLTKTRLLRHNKTSTKQATAEGCHAVEVHSRPHPLHMACSSQKVLVQDIVELLAGQFALGGWLGLLDKCCGVNCLSRWRQHSRQLLCIHEAVLVPVNVTE